MEIELKVKLIALSWESLSEMKFPLCLSFFLGRGLSAVFLYCFVLRREHLHYDE